VVDVRHEQAAAHAADAYGRLTFRPGVAAVTAGPGVTDAITGVTNAFYANSPMVLLGGRNPLGLEGMGALQDAPQVELLRPVTKRSEVALETRGCRRSSATPCATPSRPAWAPRTSTCRWTC
jgi:acetolactate synthase I/II/III large subunit